MDIDEFLEHHGVKGMKWGVRKARSIPQGPTPVTVTQRPGKRVKTSGGTGLKSHSDAVTAAKSRQKARKSSVESLSNQELQALVKRMQLEQQYSQLNAGRQNAGVKFVKAFLGSVGKTQAQSAANQYASQQIAKALAKKAVTG